MSRLLLCEQESQKHSYSHSQGLESLAVKDRVISRSQSQSRVPEKQTNDTLTQIGFLELLDTQKPLNGEVWSEIDPNQRMGVRLGTYKEIRQYMKVI